ncbi:unnamed protein product [Sympodiomycopsis kandeliae]
MSQPRQGAEQDEEHTSSHDHQAAIGLGLGMGLGLPEEASILGQPLPPPAATSVASSSRSKHKDFELSLPTQRRLVRKPLPDIPPSNSKIETYPTNTLAPPPSVPSTTVVQSTSPQKLTYEDDLAERWWPETIPTFDPTSTSDEKQSSSPSFHHQDSILDAASDAHLHTFLYYALHTDQARLPAAYHLALHSAVLEALKAIADPNVLAGLQRTACIRWRAEAQLRAAAAKNGAAAQTGGDSVLPSSAFPSRWVRLGWPAAAFRGMMQLRDITTSTASTAAAISAGPAQALEASLAESHHWKVSKEQRVRKRDVALAVLSNAVWLVTNYGSADGALHAARPAAGTDRATDNFATPRKPSTAPTTTTTKESIDPRSAAKDAPRERKVPAAKRGGLPNFIPPSTTTTALSATASPSIGPTNVQALGEAPTSLQLPSSVLDNNNPSAQSSAAATPSSSSMDFSALGNTGDSATHPGPSTLSLPSSSRHSPVESLEVSRPPTPADGNSANSSRPTSKAMEHLASLNAAAGAALKAQAKAQADKDRSNTDESAGTAVEPHPRSSAGSPVAHRITSEAEAAETAALEKAEREFIARVGSDCEERAKMVLTSIMVDIRIAESPEQNSTSSTETPSGSVLSTRSDKTIGGQRSEKDDTLRRPIADTPDPDDLVKWEGAAFRGSNLYVESPRFRHDSEAESERLKVEGGTFTIHARNLEEAVLLRSTLAVALYMACSMRLEMDLLRDIDYSRPEMNQHVKGWSQASGASDVKDMETEQEPQEASGESSTAGAAEGDVPAQSASQDSSGRRWTRGIWGLLQSGSDAVHAALVSPSSANKTDETTPKASDQLFAARRASVSPSVASSKAFPRSLTADDGVRRRTSSLNMGRHLSKDGSKAPPTKRLPTRLGRFIHHLAGGSPTASSTSGRPSTASGTPTVAEALAESAPVRASFDVSPSSEVYAKHARTRSLSAILSARNTSDPAPLSTSPELSKLLHDSKLGQTSQPESLRGLAYLHLFMQTQSLNVVVGGRSGLPAVSQTTRQAGNQGYFGSVSGASLAPSVSSRSVSAASTLAESVTSEPASVPGTPGIPASSASSVAPNARSSAAVTSADSGARQWTCLNRETVHYYRQGGSGRDIHLGHVLEDICARADAPPLHSWTRKSDSNIYPTSKKADRRNTSVTHQHPTMHYLHGEFQVSIVAQPVTGLRTSQDSTSSVADQARGSIPGAVPASTDKSAPSGTGVSLDALEGDGDVLAVAATLSADRDAARTAVALAEEAIEAAQNEQSSASRPHAMVMWSANVRSGRQTTPRIVSDATWLMSFAQYLESVMYHPGFAQNIGLIEGEDEEKGRETEDTDPQIAGAESRFDVVRFFKKNNILAKISVRPLTVFRLQTEGPTVLSRALRRPATGDTSLDKTTIEEEDVQKQTRLEIQAFYLSVKEYINELEQVIVRRSLDEHGKTIKPKAHADLISKAADGGSADDDAEIDAASAVEAEAGPVDDGPLGLLTKLKTSFRQSEWELYEAVKEGSPDYINDVRKTFKDHCRSAQQRLASWRKKHLTKEELTKQSKPPLLREPAFMSAKQHAFPGSRFIVKEDEPLSIIAFSLTSRDYHNELKIARQQREGREESTNTSAPLTATQPSDKMNDVLNWRSGVPASPSGSTASDAGGSLHEDQAAATAMSVTGSQLSTSKNSITSGLSMSYSTPKDRALDPDLDAWHVNVDPVNVSMKRKKRGRDGSILSLSLRRVGSVSAHSDHQGVGSSVAEESEEEEESFEDDFTFAASGLDPNMIDIGSMTHNSQSHASTRSMSSPAIGSRRQLGSSTISSARTNSTFRAHVTQVSGRPQSLASVFSREDGSAIAPWKTDSVAVASEDEDDSQTASQASESRMKTPRRRPTGGSWAGETKGNNGTTTDSTPTADRKQFQPQAQRTSSIPAPVSVESPHIKHSLYHGSTKVSCVSWFAEEFGALRRRWGIEEDFVESLAHSRPWQTSGGKSRSHFFKTTDDKWIGKQLLTVWSVDEKDALLEFAPAYIRYMLNADANDCPSLLVKIAGFYSLKIKDSKETKLKMSVMILENLFADVKTKTTRFDLKGIKDRRTPVTRSDKPSGANPSAPSTPHPGHSVAEESVASAPGAGTGDEIPAVYWDAEWLEQYASRAFVPEKDRDLFLQAMRNDLSFLTESNVMDFSLLVGVTDASYDSSGNQTAPPSIRVRIVDYIGAYTLAKQLESSSKKVLKSSEAKGNVTVLPPLQYAARFESAMLGYFIGVPQRQIPHKGAGKKGAGMVERPVIVSSVL